MFAKAALCCVYPDKITQVTGKSRQELNGIGFELLKHLAEKGYSAAKFYLGEYFRLGLGVPKDKQQALRWYAEAKQEFLKLYSPGVYGRWLQLADQEIQALNR